ncbi:Putative esterase [Pseudobutyrivibrio sp. 49]|uniref:alpha/beta hydrolase n=1 Tax=Pseudobutyrivibrio sp. 49 TaxID=1855344 RepID=UPI00088E9A32|nr:alpha/beta hydrolase-fold protein [Pseudobutyrivibrio sp. 49]SDH99799.1 Putative esterase [Pseudobutyrivibrio sp. 49]
MVKENFQIQTTNCIAFMDEAPEVVLVQPVDPHDYEMLDSETKYITEHTDKPFILIAFSVNDWNKDLSPWPAPPVFGKEGFGDGAKETLAFVINELIPTVKTKYDISQDIPIILGGYSLAGLFALWSAYQTNAFTAIAAASPSVWFPSFLDYAKSEDICVKHIYLSLGDKEEKARNPIMSTVGNCIRELSDYYQSKELASTLEWNDGNHFKDADIRTAKGFTWVSNEVNQ